MLRSNFSPPPYHPVEMMLTDRTKKCSLAFLLGFTFNSFLEKGQMEAPSAEQIRIDEYTQSDNEVPRISPTDSLRKVNALKIMN